MHQVRPVLVDFQAASSASRTSTDRLRRAPLAGEFLMGPSINAMWSPMSPLLMTCPPGQSGFGHALSRAGRRYSPLSSLSFVTDRGASGQNWASNGWQKCGNVVGGWLCLTPGGPTGYGGILEIDRSTRARQRGGNYRNGGGTTSPAHILSMLVRISSSSCM